MRAAQEESAKGPTPEASPAPGAPEWPMWLHSLLRGLDRAWFAVMRGAGRVRLQSSLSSYPSSSSLSSSSFQVPELAPGVDVDGEVVVAASVVRLWVGAAVGGVAGSGRAPRSPGC